MKKIKIAILIIAQLLLVILPTLILTNLMFKNIVEPGWSYENIYLFLSSVFVLILANRGSGIYIDKLNTKIEKIIENKDKAGEK